MKFKMKLAVFLIALAVVPAAYADGIDFAGFTGGGSVSFTPGVGNTLSVANAPINLLWALSEPGTKYWFAPLANPSQQGLLNFTTGGATSVDSGSLACPGVCATFGAGSDPSTPDLTIVGEVYRRNGDGTDSLIASGSLLKGEFVGGKADFLFGMGFIGGLFNITELNNDLTMALFGFVPADGSTKLGTFGQVVFNLELNDDGSIGGSIGSTNLIAGIPEPASLTLVGAGLLFCGRLVRRRFDNPSV